MKILRNFFLCIFFAFGYFQIAYSAEIVQHLRWAWSENIGWINFSPDLGDVHITNGRFLGIVWSQTHGWINLAPENGGIKVHNFLQADGRCMASLEGMAWGRNTGWIDFSETFIDNNGEFYGFAYGHITGKITFGGDTFRLRSNYLPQCNGVSVLQRELSHTSLGPVSVHTALDTSLEFQVNNEQVTIQEVQEVQEVKEVIAFDNYVIEDNFSYCPNIASLKNNSLSYQENRFNDEVKIQYKEEVLKFAELGIANGYKNGDFGPGNILTRAEFLKLLFVSHCYDYSGLDYKSHFADLDTGSWQNRVVNKATQLGIINGDTTSYDSQLLKTPLYHGNSGASVKELKKVFSFLGLYSGEVDNYYGNNFRNAIINFQLDNNVISSRYSQGAGSWGPGTQQAFFNSYPENSIPVFRPNDYVTKIEALKILMNISGMRAENPNSIEIPYSETYADWQKTYIKAALASEVLDRNDSNFYPNHGIERQYIIYLMYKTIQKY